MDSNCSGSKFKGSRFTVELMVDVHEFRPSPARFEPDKRSI
jgi:hypothetical protein